MKRMTTLTALAAALTLAGCAFHGGTQTVNDFMLFQQVQQGVTTKAQLHALFGQPHEVRHANPSETTWTYYHVTSRTNPSTYIPIIGLATGGSDLDVTIAEFTFDGAGVLSRARREQRSQYVNQWAGLADAATPTGQVAAVEAEMSHLGLPFDRREARAAASWADRARR